MLKHDRTRPRKKSWTMRYLRWLQEQQFDQPAHQIALQEMVEAVRVGREWVDRLERTIKEFVSGWSLEPLVRALQTLRGVDLIVAATFATEVGDVSRRAQSTHGFPRPSAERTIDRSLSGAAASPRPTFAICLHVHPAARLIRNEPDQLVRTVDIWRRTRAGLAKGGGHHLNLGAAHLADARTATVSPTSSTSRMIPTWSTSCKT